MRSVGKDNNAIFFFFLRQIRKECERFLLGFLASGGEEFNPGPETRLDYSELLCKKVLLKYKRESL